MPFIVCLLVDVLAEPLDDVNQLKHSAELTIQGPHFDAFTGTIDIAVFADSEGIHLQVSLLPHCYIANSGACQELFETYVSAASHLGLCWFLSNYPIIRLHRHRWLGHDSFSRCVSILCHCYSRVDQLCQVLLAGNLGVVNQLAGDLHGRIICRHRLNPVDSLPIIISKCVAAFFLMVVAHVIKHSHRLAQDLRIVARNVGQCKNVLCQLVVAIVFESQLLLVCEAVTKLMQAGCVGHHTAVLFAVEALLQDVKEAIAIADAQDEVALVVLVFAGNGACVAVGDCVIVECHVHLVDVVRHVTNLHEVLRPGSDGLGIARLCHLGLGCGCQ